MKSRQSQAALEFLMFQKRSFLKPKNSNRGQAALEFLMTYGWAFLAIGIAFAGITYFGVTSPERFAPEQCLSEMSFPCVDYQVQYQDASAGLIQLQLVNGVGHRINISDVNLSKLSGASGVCTVQTGDIEIMNSSGSNSFLPAQVSASDSFTLLLPCDDSSITIDEGDVLAFDIDIRYVIDKPGYFDRVSRVSVVTDAGVPHS